MEFNKYSDAKSDVSNLAAKINHLISDFEFNTGLVVAAVDIERESSRTKDGFVYAQKLNVIPRVIVPHD